MTTYNAIPDSLLEPGDPITSDIGFRWRDNPIAMFEGSAGAPRLQLAALDAGFTTAGGIGSYVLAYTSANVAFGATRAGSTLFPTSALRGQSNNLIDAFAFDAGAALAGTWQCMGQFDQSISAPNSGYGVTLWMRIA